MVFSGPGSPSYALRIWAGTPVPAILAAKLRRRRPDHGSAASITLGRFALPVYEVYKVGADPFWLDGLDILGAQGIAAVVVPHWNNAEGGTHDTSRCWLGARRFTALAGRLPPGVVVLGIDEHTAGVSTSTPAASRWRARAPSPARRRSRPPCWGRVRRLPLRLGRRPRRPRCLAPAPASPAPGAAAFETAFAAALETGDCGAALDAILSLEDAHQAWEPAAAAAAHDALRAMATRFAAAMAGAAPDDAARAGAVEALLGVRTRARDEGAGRTPTPSAAP